MRNWQTQLRKGLMDIVILNLLRRGKCHGYEMVQILRQSDALMMREGNIYHLMFLTTGVIPASL
jgi:PadR family transcriptional regulator PadR